MNIGENVEIVRNVLKLRTEHSDNIHECGLNFEVKMFYIGVLTSSFRTIMIQLWGNKSLKCGDEQTYASCLRAWNQIKCLFNNEKEKVMRKKNVELVTETNITETNQEPKMKRGGRKRKGVVSTSRSGWGILNRETNYLVQEFYLRRTDAISKLEQDEKKPWSLLKKESPMIPVRIDIQIKQEVEL